MSGTLEGHNVSHFETRCGVGGGRTRTRRTGYTKLRIDLVTDFTQPIVDVIARACFVRVVAMDGYVATIAVIDPIVLVGGPHQLFDPVSFADVRHEFNEGFHGSVGDGIRIIGFGGNFDCHGTVVIRRGGSAPGTVFLIHIESNSSIGSNTVVGGSFSSRLGKQTATALHTQFPGHAVRTDGVDGVVPCTGMVGTLAGITHQTTVGIRHAQSSPLLLLNSLSNSSVFGSSSSLTGMGFGSINIRVQLLYKDIFSI